MTRDDFNNKLDAILKDTVGEFPISESELEGVKKAQSKLVRTLFKNIK